MYLNRNWKTWIGPSLFSFQQKVGKSLSSPGRYQSNQSTTECSVFKYQIGYECPSLLCSNSPMGSERVVGVSAIALAFKKEFLTLTWWHFHGKWTITSHLKGQNAATMPTQPNERTHMLTERAQCPTSAGGVSCLAATRSLGEIRWNRVEWMT